MEKNIQLKKKILVTTHTMHIGGVERSFLALLEKFNYSQYEVDVFIYSHEGEMIDQIPTKAHLIKENKSYSSLFKPIKTVIAEKQWGVLCAKILAHVHAFIFGLFPRNKVNQDSFIHVYLYYYASFFLPKISSKRYDAVLAFLHPNYFESLKVDASRRIGWIHTDYSYLNTDRNFEANMWKKLDHIAAVSDAVGSSFMEVFPELKNKVITIENLLSEDFVENESKEFSPFSDLDGSYLKFCSVGRFTYHKNFDNIPAVADILRRKNIKFIWYILGYGTDEQIILDNIKRHNVEDCVMVLGKKKNPYPYMAACDLYIQPSRSEGKAVTVREAQILNKPVIITDYPTASSQLRDGVDGLIAPMDNEGLANFIYETLLNKSKLANIVDATKNGNYSNDNEIKKIEQLINE